MVLVQSCCFANKTYVFFDVLVTVRWILKSLFPHLIRCPVAGYFWKRRFFSCLFSIPSMRKRRFRAPKMLVFYKGPRVQILENAGFSVTSGRTKTMMSCIRTTSITRAPYQMLSYFHRFSVFMWTNEYAICGRVFLKTERKKISGQRPWQRQQKPY